MSAPAVARYYEDLEIGEVRESSSRALTEAELLEFARRYDPQWFHADPVAARDSIFGGVVASGIHTMALWRQLDHEIARDIRWICGVAWHEARWPNPVRAGDALRARTEILSKRPSASDPTRGVVECRYTLLNQRNETAFTCTSVNLIERRATGTMTTGTAPPHR
jgi:acyl dehydratase